MLIMEITIIIFDEWSEIVIILHILNRSRHININEDGLTDEISKWRKMRWTQRRGKQ